MRFAGGLAMVAALACGQALGQAAQRTPLVALITNPEQHSGVVVSTMGVLDRERGGFARLCLNLESAAHDVAFNCVVVRDDARFQKLVSGIEDGAEGRYVQLIGTFDSSRPRPLRYAGVIKDLRVIRPLPYDL